MMPTCHARDCPRATHDVLCRQHRDELLAALCELAWTVNANGRRGPGLLEALDHAAARRTRRGPATPTGSRPTGVPLLPTFDAKASRLADHVANTISTWARSFADAFPSLRPTYTSVAGACTWLATHPRELGGFWEAGQMHHEITRLIPAIERAVDPHDELRYAGMCSALLDDGTECDQDLYAPPDRAVIRCRACGTQHDVDHRRDVLADAVKDQLATAVDCSRIAPNLIGRELSASTIRGWAREGRLERKPPHPLDERQAPRYRLGDVVALARTTQTRRRPAHAHHRAS